MPDNAEPVQIALHGRGGQGVKTAGDLLVHALVAARYRVNGQPLYGGERMGAPVMYFIRFTRSTAPIHDRSLVRRPEIMLVFDATMLAATPGIVATLEPGGLLVANSTKAAAELPRLAPRAAATLPASRIARECGLVRGTVPIVGPVMAGAFAAATGLVSLSTLEHCLAEVTAEMSEERIASNVAGLRRGWEAVAPLAGTWRQRRHAEQRW